MKALRLKVETLCVFRLVIDEGPDLVLVLTPDVDARIGFASEASRRLLGVAHTALEGRSLWDLLHTDDKPAVLKVISETILGRGTRRRVDARIRARGPPPAPPEGDASAGEGPAGPQEGGEEEGPVEYMRVGVSMKYGPQGILAFLRPRLEEGGAAGAV